jgi:hypothetical protein
MFDMVLTALSFSDLLQDSPSLFSTGDIVIVIILAIDVCLRWFSLGSAFVKPARECKMNIFEAVLVPITIAEVTVLKDLDLPLPLLRALRPVLRGVRLLRVLIRTAGKGKQYLRRLRHQVSGDRLRYIQDGFDLDLQYITPQILVMTDPAIGGDQLLRNPMREVASFLNQKHGNKYLVLNTSERRTYPQAPFFHRCYHFGIMQDGVPTLDGLKNLVRNLDAWLKADDAHVLAVHSKHNQGRVALVVIALMLYRKDYRSATNALSAFEHHRKKKEGPDMESAQTLDSMSQTRFLEYFAHVCSRGNAIPLRPATITKIQLSGVSNVQNLDVVCFTHPKAGFVTDISRASRSCTSSLNASDPFAVGLFRQKKARSMNSTDDDDMDGLVAEDQSSVLQKVANAIEEGAMDSRRSGAVPLRGKPVFSSSVQEEHDPEKPESLLVKAKTLKNNDTNVALAQIWEPPRVELDGEIRLEVHLKKGTEKIMDGDTPSGSWCCCRRRQRESNRKFSDGMLFGCWLHSALLEHDEVEKKRSGRSKPGNRLEINLDRFAVDKAAFAPSLRSLSTAMKLEIEFHVEKRIQLQDLDNDPPELHLMTANVDMSEWETLNWMTWVSEKVWPSFKTGFTKMITEGVEGAREGLPGPLKSMRVAECSFGEAFPKFGPICASSACHLNDQEGQTQGVQLDIGLTYSTDTSIVLEVGYLHFGITHLKIAGMLSLKFTPLLDEIPVFSAMQLFFLNSPEVDLRFANVLEVANTAFLMDKIRAEIKKRIHSRLVLPNVLNINWADPSNDDTCTWASVMPSYVVRIDILRARELRSSNSILIRDPESHVRLSVGEQTVKGPSVKGTNPFWNYSCDFVIFDARQHLVVQVFDTDFTGSSWPIGKMNTLPVVKLADEGKNVGIWQPLQGAPGRANSEIFITATVFDLQADPSGLREEAVALQSPVPNISPGKSRRSVQLQLQQVEAALLDKITIIDSEKTEEEAAETNVDEEELEDGRSGARALLVCTILGGQIPTELGKAAEVTLRSSFSTAADSKPCQDPEEGSEGSLSEKTRRAVEKLSSKGMQAPEIAETLGEEVDVVQRVVRRQTCNMAVQQKLCLLIKTSDFEEGTDVHFSFLTAKKKVVADGTFPMNTLLESPTGKCDCEINCRSGLSSGAEIKLHVTMRLFNLRRRHVENEDDPRMTSKSSNCLSV